MGAIRLLTQRQVKAMASRSRILDADPTIAFGRF
jgi:hypothetical protein